MSVGLYRAINTHLLIGAVLVLALSCWLEPDPSGVGTHTQLGFSSCVVLGFLEIPCPMCGMTTTFALMADLRVLDAFHNQPFGVLLFLLTIVLAIVSGVELLSPRSLWQRISDRMLGIEVKVVGTLFVMMAAAWGYKVVQMQIFLTASP